MSKIKILIIGRRKDKIASYKSFSKPRAGIFAIIFAVVAGIAIYFSFAATPQAPLAKGAVVICSTANQEAPQLAAAGAKMVRIQTMSWGGIEPSKGVYNDSYLDSWKNCLDIYHNYGIKTLVLVDNTPQWAARNWTPSVPGLPPSNNQDFADFFTHIVPILGNRVDAWEIYNEPNLGEFWTGDDNDYANLLNAAYPAIKAADVASGLCPTVTSDSCQKVVMAGLAMIGDAEDPSGTKRGTAANWIRHMYMDNARSDVIALHPYPRLNEGDNFGCNSPSDTGSTITQGIPNDHGIMKNNGDGDKPIWLTEWGYASSDCMAPALDYIKANEPYVQNTMWFIDSGIPLGDTASGPSTGGNAVFKGFTLFDDPYDGNHWRVGPDRGWTFKDVSIDWGDGSPAINKQTSLTATHTYPTNHTVYTAHVTLDYSGSGATPQLVTCQIYVGRQQPHYCSGILFQTNPNKDVTATVGASPWLSPDSKYSAMKDWPNGNGGPAPLMEDLSVTGSGASLSVAATAHSDYNNVAKIDFYDANTHQVLQTVNASPYRFDTSKLSPGINYKIYAIATDYLGRASSRSNTISIGSPPPPPPNGNSTISGSFKGSDIVIKTSSQYAGAVSSLTWGGLQFIDTTDHGREMQAAVHLSASQGGSECINPTEAGSFDDGAGDNSSSVVQSMSASGNSLTARTKLAYWLKPGEKGPNCKGGAPVHIQPSDTTLTKTITIGYDNLANVINSANTFSLGSDSGNYSQYEGLSIFEAPTMYLPASFNNFYTYDPLAKHLATVSITPTLNYTFKTGAVIVAHDNAHAIGYYTPVLYDPNDHNSVQMTHLTMLRYFPASSGIAGPTTQVGQWFQRNNIVPGTYKFRSFAVVGSLGDVESALNKLYQQDNPALPPSVTLTSPTDGATLVGKVDISANAKANGAAIGSVSYKLTYPDGTVASLGPALTLSPYVYKWDTTSLANGNYKLNAIATDAAGNSATSQAVNVTINNPPPKTDKTKPSVPTGLSSTQSQTSVTLKWKASKDNQGGSGMKDYKIYRDGNYVSSTTLLSFNDSGLTNFTKYSYQVTAEDNADNESAKSAKLSSTTLPPAPSVTFGSVAGTRVRGTITLTATADSKASVSSVKFTLDGSTALGTDSSSPYSVSWNTASTSDGPHKITAVATDSTGQKSKPSEWDVFVDNTKPTVAVTSPKNRAQVRGSLNLSAKASDNDSIASVQFMIDGKGLLGTADTHAPYAYEWYSPNYADGAHTITAVATDQAGNKTTSAAINITIKNKGSGSGDQIAPSIPSNLKAGAITQNSIGLSWSASTDDPSGSGLAGYIIYRNGTILTTTDKTSFTDINLSPGTNYSYSIAAFDKSSNRSDQSPVLTLATQVLTIQPGDSNGDGRVDVSDLSTLLHFYKGANRNCDFNHDGKIDVADLSILLSNYGRKYR